MQNKNTITFENNTVIINGGLGLIGSSISKKFLENGANVIIIDKDKKKSKSFILSNIKFKKKIRIINLDSTKNISLDKIIKEIKKLKRIDSFVNCSYPRDKNWDKNTFDSNDLNAFKDNLNINFISNAWLSKQIVEHIKTKKFKASIVLFSSIYGMVGQDPNIYIGTNLKENLCYSIIKGGMLNFTRLMASYYGKYNIRINCISPGGVRNKKNKLQNIKFLKNYSKRVPINRMANPEEIANCVIFLCSNLSSYMNGANLVVDGGWTSI